MKFPNLNWRVAAIFYLAAIGYTYVGFLVGQIAAGVQIKFWPNLILGIALDLLILYRMYKDVK